VFYEFAESYAPELLAGATEDLWALITLGAAENAVWTEVVDLFRDDMDDDTTQSPPSYNVAGLFRAYYLVGNPPHSTASLTRRTQRQSGGPTASINGVRVYALVQLLHSRGRLTESCLLKSNRFPRSLRMLAGRSWGVSLLDPPILTRSSTEWPSAYAY
jgi:hypothetical protein